MDSLDWDWWVDLGLWPWGSRLERELVWDIALASLIFAGQNLASRYLPRPRELVDYSRVGSCRISIFSPAIIKVATGSAYQCRSRNNYQHRGPRFLYKNTIGQPCFRSLRYTTRWVAVRLREGAPAPTLSLRNPLPVKMHPRTP